MKIAVRGGHLFSIPGAKYLIDETTEDRRVLAAFLDLCNKYNIEVLNVTPPEGLSSSAELSYGVKKANDWGADIFISLHFNNCYNKLMNIAMGFEMCVARPNQYGSRIGTELKALGLKMRHSENNGQYVSDRGLYEIKATNMTAIIVEPLFVESSVDVEIYNNVGPEGIAAAILRGITGNSDIAVGSKGRWEKLAEGWKYIKDGKYVQDEWVEDNNKWYYINEKELMVTGWFQVDEKWYYAYSDGSCAVNWESINGNWYYFYPSSSGHCQCEMATGWVKIDGEWYFLNIDDPAKPEGAMMTGWLLDGENWYYLYSNGVMAHDCTLYGWKIDSEGHATKL